MPEDLLLLEDKPISFQVAHGNPFLIKVECQVGTWTLLLFIKGLTIMIARQVRGPS